MSYPTLEAITLMKSYINTSISGGFTNNDIYLCDALNNPDYSGNPVTVNYIPSYFDASTIMNVLSNSSIKTVLDLSATPVAVVPLLNTNPKSPMDIYFCNVWAQAYLSMGIQLDEYISITGIINGVQPDPSWQSGVSWSSIYLRRNATLNDIESCR